MKLELFGGRSSGGWSAHGEYEPGVDPVLRPCPFCHSKNLTVENTHTPYYHAQCCDCRAEGPRVSSIGDRWARALSKAAVARLHREAFAAAIKAWNWAGNIQVPDLQVFRGTVAHADATVALLENCEETFPQLRHLTQ
jgi:hypothetical protein